MSESNVFGELIDVYSRAEALADGVLIDASDLAREIGFRFPVEYDRLVM
jgi:type I site-specific restriction endonuclease